MTFPRRRIRSRSKAREPELLQTEEQHHICFTFLFKESPAQTVASPARKTQDDTQGVPRRPELTDVASSNADPSRVRR